MAAKHTHPPQPVYLTHLTLQNYRNFAEIDLDLDQGRTVMSGGNAQGKTNLLEAIYMLATGKAARATHEREVVRWEALAEEVPFARVRGAAERMGGPVGLEVVIQLGRPPAGGAPRDLDRGGHLQKRVRVNGVPKRGGDLIGEIKAVLFTPQDIELVHGAPSVRRRYLDMTLSQVDRPLVRELQRYGRVLSQRNNLLKSIREGRSGPDELEFWDKELIEAGSYITETRTEAMAAMQPLASQVHRELTGENEVLELVYVPSVAAGQVGVAEAFREALDSKRERELLQAVSLVGPHRDDLQFICNGRDLGVFGSRGQQRTASLSLRLAEAQFMEERAADPPVLLLDDVFSELDGFRRSYLLSWVARVGQALLTTAEPERLDRALLPRATFLEVDRGRVSQPVGLHEPPEGRW